MKRTMMTAISMAIALPLMAQAAPAEAKQNRDWIENISVEKDGIDTAKVEVRPKNGQYRDVMTNTYRFLLSGHVKAKKNRKISRVVWQSKQNPFFASGPNKPSWEKRGLIRLGQRETTIDGKQSIPLSRLTWVESPRQACTNLKQQKRAAGMSSDAILARDWNTTAKAAIHMKAYVTRKKAKTLTDTNYDTETAMMAYPVNVKCLAQAPAPEARQTASTKKGQSKPPARRPRVPIK